MRRRPLDPKSRADLDRYAFELHQELAADVARVAARTVDRFTCGNPFMLGAPWPSRAQAAEWIVRVGLDAYHTRERLDALRALDAQLLDPKLSTPELVRRLLAGNWTEVRAADGLLERCNREWRQ